MQEGQPFRHGQSRTSSVRAQKECGEEGECLLRKTDPAFVPVINKNRRLSVLTKCGSGQPPDIPAVAHDVEGHEGNERVFRAMQAPGKIETGGG